mmetsp:Transcript_106715/g.332772  ORF Transcript_106715/g.332772 Transcript_106715/m.332772 type:complete len:210 (+) Transcript_106715:52-681(+)
MPQMTTSTTDMGAAGGNLRASLATRASRDKRARRTTRRSWRASKAPPLMASSKYRGTIATKSQMFRGVMTNSRSVVRFRASATSKRTKNSRVKSTVKKSSVANQISFSLSDISDSLPEMSGSSTMLMTERRIMPEMIPDRAAACAELFGSSRSSATLARQVLGASTVSVSSSIALPLRQPCFVSRRFTVLQCRVCTSWPQNSACSSVKR